MSNRRAGFTLVELLVAITMLSVGLLAFLGSSALDTRLLSRERRIDQAAIFAGKRLEALRIDACRRHVDSSEVLMVGAETLAVNTWTFTSVNSGNLYRVTLTNKYLTAPRGGASTAARYSNSHRTDTYETGISCAL